LREFDDQNRVFRRETDERDDANLRVQVVRIRANADRHQRTEQTERHSEYHGERRTPAFIQSGKKQQHENGREAEYEWLGSLAAALLKDGARPLVPEAWRQHLTPHL